MNYKEIGQKTGSILTTIFGGGSGGSSITKYILFTLIGIIVALLIWKGIDTKNIKADYEGKLYKHEVTICDLKDQLFDLQIAASEKDTSYKKNIGKLQATLLLAQEKQNLYKKEIAFLKLNPEVKYITIRDEETQETEDTVRVYEDVLTRGALTLKPKIIHTGYLLDFSFDYDYDSPVVTETKILYRDKLIEAPFKPAVAVSASVGLDCLGAGVNYWGWANFALGYRYFYADKKQYHMLNMDFKL